MIASIITDELPAERPFLLEGCGPQLRICCLYGAKAIEAGSDIDALSWNPTDGDWTMHVPCDGANLDWVRKALIKTSPRIIAARAHKGLASALTREQNHVLDEGLGAGCGQIGDAEIARPARSPISAGTSGPRSYAEPPDCA